MKARMWIPMVIFLAGVATIAYSVATGEARVSLVVIFPVFTGSSGLFLLGILLIVLSFFVGFGMLAMEPTTTGTDGPPTDQADMPQRTRQRTRYGGVVLIGPIPIAFGSDKKLALTMLVIGIALVIVLFVALFLLG